MMVSGRWTTSAGVYGTLGEEGEKGNASVVPGGVSGSGTLAGRRLRLVFFRLLGISAARLDGSTEMLMERMAGGRAESIGKDGVGE
jgi:hypothetical protein